jgi:hypothetical protein
MRDAFDDPSELFPEERLAEVAAILAEGVRRLLRRRIGVTEACKATPDDEQIPAESSRNSLEFNAPSYEGVRFGRGNHTVFD